MNRRDVAAALTLCAALAGCDATGMVDSGGAAPTPTPEPSPFVVCINEFVASNGSGPVDEAGDRDDWIELHNPSTDPISLRGWTISDDPEEPSRHRFGAGLVIEAGGFVLLWADGQVEQGEDHLAFALDRAGGALSIRDAHGQGSTIHYGPLGADRAAARSSDCCSGEGCFELVVGGTPGRSNETTAATDEVLLERGATWRYLDTGVDSGIDWKSSGFDDSGWAVGAAPFGYGDEHIVSTLDGGERPIWLRASFDVGPDGGGSPNLRLLRDGGVVVHLNGQEVARALLLLGPVGPDSWATRAVDGQEETLYFPVELDPTLLVDGANQLAVELVPGGDGSDLGFDLELRRP